MTSVSKQKNKWMNNINANVITSIIETDIYNYNKYYENNHLVLQKNLKGNVNKRC